MNEHEIRIAQNKRFNKVIESKSPEERERIYEVLARSNALRKAFTEAVRNNNINQYHDAAERIKSKNDVHFEHSSDLSIVAYQYFDITAAIPEDKGDVITDYFTFADMEAFKEILPEHTRQILAVQIEVSMGIINDPEAGIDDVREHSEIIKDITERMNIAIGAFADRRKIDEQLKELYKN